MDKLFVGVDVSKDHVDIAIAGGRKLVRLVNNQGEISSYLKTIKSRVALLAFEPTGGYERALHRSLAALSISFVRVHPNEVAAFRKAKRLKAKTDAIDARLLADFARDELSTRKAGLHIEADETLRDLTTRRRQLSLTLHAERCRLALAQSRPIKTSLKSLIAALERALKVIEREIEAHICSSQVLAERAANLRSLKSVGPITAATLLGELPELGRLSGKQIAALVGLAPHTRDSGKTSFRAKTGHGRPGVRAVLFNAARCAIRHNACFRTFYQRLVHDNGRPGKVALVAVMRKLLVTLNAMARENKPWRFAQA